MSRIANRDALLRDDRHGRRGLALDLLEVALAAVDPARSTAVALSRAEDEGALLEGCLLLAFGKASRGMAEAAVARCDPRGGLVVGLADGALGPLPMQASDHPVPGPRAFRNGTAMLDLARGAGEGETVLCLISGGASAMVEAAVPGVTPEELAEATRLLLGCGAPIEELNAVRRALSRIKGGRLAEVIHPARVVNVILSDVPGADPSVVASGPTMRAEPGPDPSDVVARRGLSGRLPSTVREALRAERAPVPEGILRGVRSYVAADNDAAVGAVVHEAARRGVRLVRLPGHLTGEARLAGERVLEEARRRPDADGVIWGGETVVRLLGDGRGGRNQELVLGALPRLDAGLLLSFGTDGIDGHSDAAGALADAGIIDAARAAEVDPEAHLARNDSAAFFSAAGGSIITGPTGTNVADLCLYLR